MSLVALALIVGICRWVFGTGKRPVPPPAATEDLGLLAPVAEVRTLADAQMLRELLTDAGIRASVSDSPTGLRVLVFQKDLTLARQLVGAG